MSKSPLAQRLWAARLTIADLSFLTTISETRLREHSKGRVKLTPLELQAVDQAIDHRLVLISRKLGLDERVTLKLSEAKVPQTA